MSLVRLRQHPQTTTCDSYLLQPRTTRLHRLHIYWLTVTSVCVCVLREACGIPASNVKNVNEHNSDLKVVTISVGKFSYCRCGSMWDPSLSRGEAPLDELKRLIRVGSNEAHAVRRSSRCTRPLWMVRCSSQYEIFTATDYSIYSFIDERKHWCVSQFLAH